MDSLDNKRVLVVGLARSGLAVAKFLCSQGARVTITDERSEPLLGTFPQKARELGCELALGGHPLEIFSGSDLVVLSPGVPLDLQPLNLARERSIPVIGELELACRFLHLPVVAITGTNGKTTTTTLVGTMLEQSGVRTFVGGNIGNPLSNIFFLENAPEVAVVEVSSFQLDSSSTFHPQVGVLLNISEDHLDRYDSFEEYVASKCRIFMNQSQTDKAILPAVAPYFMDYGRIRSQHLLFGSKATLAHARVDSGTLICSMGPGCKVHYDLSQWRLPGRHNLDNLLAAVLAATSMGARPEAIQRTIDSFSGLPHRMELICHWRGIRFYNDSKATNIAAVCSSLASFCDPIILIAGGRYKGGPLKSLVPLVNERVKMLLLMGEARFEFARVFSSCGCTMVVDSMERAVREAIAAAVPGDVVLLAPACASFDLYENYEARGDHFRSIVAAVTSELRNADGCLETCSLSESSSVSRS
ncbi:MAG: UDP-N-acetylmuramoyl-L-alanine--D-glutamate ligase [Deltaproteobacteria bacterium]|nr:UDP-N-acetylmuramoyl-L-alanine--D-glutamate ligase [Deltaproteobacteria bacterium]MBW2071628.1 UDP-N-acetylmuramoyl-L-alanine--D-glutamate ligase [Deltaproteobacteria bacterium]